MISMPSCQSSSTVLDSMLNCFVKENLQQGCRARGVPNSIVMVTNATTIMVLTHAAAACAASVACACQQAILIWLLAVHTMSRCCFPVIHQTCGHITYRCTGCLLHWSPLKGALSGPDDSDLIQKMCTRQSCLSAVTHTQMWSTQQPWNATPGVGDSWALQCPPSLVLH